MCSVCTIFHVLAFPLSPPSVPYMCIFLLPLLYSCYISRGLAILAWLWVSLFLFSCPRHLCQITRVLLWYPSAAAVVLLPSNGYNNFLYRHIILFLVEAVIVLSNNNDLSSFNRFWIPPWRTLDSDPRITTISSCFLSCALSSIFLFAVPFSCLFFLLSSTELQLKINCLLPRRWVQEIKRMYPVLLTHSLFLT